MRGTLYVLLSFPVFRFKFCRICTLEGLIFENLLIINELESCDALHQLQQHPISQFLEFFLCQAEIIFAYISRVFIQKRVFMCPFLNRCLHQRPWCSRKFCVANLPYCMSGISQESSDPSVQVTASLAWNTPPSHRSRVRRGRV